MTADQDQPQTPPATLALPEPSDRLCLVVLALFTLGIFAKVLFISPEYVLSDRRWDLNYFFLNWRYFGFHELKSGNLALWDPHCASGTPFFGNMQSALLYPLNFLYLILQLTAAVNWTIALHLFLGGALTYWWVRSRGLHRLACLLAALMFMFCGPHFLQIQVGHLPNLATLIWAPLLFLAIDKTVDGPSLRWCLMGMFAVCMAILAGHPQYVFYLGVAAGIYSLLNLVRSERRGQVLFGLGVVAVGGVALSAVQLFTGIQEGRENARSVGMTYEFASSFSFPPENFLTLVAPWSLGDMQEHPYWGRFYLTEVSLFVSTMGLALAVYGMARGRPETRRFSICMLLVTLVLAMGCYTPLFPFLYRHVPGFNLFRGMDKFLWLAALFLSMLAAIGMDQMLRRGQVPMWLVLGAAGLGIFLFALSTLPTQLGWWAGVLKKIAESGTSLQPTSNFYQPQFIANTSTQASLSLILGGFTLFVVAGLLYLAKSHRPLACIAMLAMAIFELTVFASSSLESFKPEAWYSPGVLDFLAEHPGDYRIQHFNPNAAMTTGALDIAGDDPSGLLRYNRFLDFSEGIDYDLAPVGQPAKFYNTNALRMVRFRYGFSSNDRDVYQFDDPLPHVSLVKHFRAMTDYHKIFTTLTNANFDMHNEVILEKQPDPLPQASAEKGTVTLLRSSTDYLEIEARVPAPTLLFITDAYSSNWRALPMPGSDQAKYEVMPANYCLRAIPLQAGHHLLRVEYSPSGFRIGRGVSIVSLVIFLALSGLAIRNPILRLTEAKGVDTVQNQNDQESEK